MANESKTAIKSGSPEQVFFERLNGLLIPYIKRGRGSPGILPTGLVLLETIGRKSGKMFQVPVFAAQLPDGFLLVGTVRKQSQWIRNLAAAEEVVFWLAGERRRARVRAFEPATDGRPETRGLPWRMALLVTAVNAAAIGVGGSFALLQLLDATPGRPVSGGMRAG